MRIAGYKRNAITEYEEGAYRAGWTGSVGCILYNYGWVRYVWVDA